MLICTKEEILTKTVEKEKDHSSKDEKLVSPASSITSSDFDEKSLGSESCDGSIKGTKLVFTGINSLEKEKIKITSDTRQFQLIEQIIRETKESEASNAKIQTTLIRLVYGRKSSKKLLKTAFTLIEKIRGS